METREREILARFAIADPYAPPVEHAETSR
jgi:hypothetical protein